MNGMRSSAPPKPTRPARTPVNSPEPMEIRTNRVSVLRDLGPIPSREAGVYVRLRVRSRLGKRNGLRSLPEALAEGAGGCNVAQATEEWPVGPRPQAPGALEGRT